MSSDKDRSDVEQWKRRYFDQLAAYETRDRQWCEAEELLRKTISRLSLAAEGQDGKLDIQLRGLRQVIRDRVSSEQLRAVIESMSTVLLKIDASEQPPDYQNGSREGGSAPGLLQRLWSKSPKTLQPGDFAAPVAAGARVRDILLQLLERLSLPDNLADKVGRLRERIVASAQQDSWDDIVEEIADLVQAVRIQTQKEKQGIEAFLRELGEQLQEVHRQLAGSEQYYDASFAAGAALDSAVKQGMSGLETGMRQARDLGQIQQLVQLHIDTVLAHMAEHREREQQRYASAKEEIRTTNERLRDLEAESTQLRARIHQERNQALSDALTGIPNRLAWEEQVEQEVVRWKRFATPLVLLIWDIDHFKTVNDNFGHKAGDKVLRTVARVLADSIRETDFIARYGGEEFVQLMTGAALADCLVVADKLRTGIQATGFHFRGKSVTITASCGMAQFRDGDSIESWFERADQALYAAKRNGRNRCEPEQGA